MVLISLFLQSILILIGNRRKHSTSNMVRIVLWLAYLSADSVATVSLGILANNQEDNNSAGDSEKPTNFVIAAFWAPFLLLHLGGPDTITAYSLEDNELWLRHLLGLVVQVVVAFYVFLRAWSSRAMNFLAIPMFIVGIIKFGERTWVLMSASSEHFRESMLPHPDPGPNYARYMEDYSSKKAEGYRVEAGVFIEAPIVGDHFSDAQDIDTTQSAALLNKAYTFFKTFKRLCADLILSFHDIVNSQSFFQNRNAEQAFQVIELELGFMYDVFYTKALLVYSSTGGILRCITLSFTVSVFVVFSLITEKHTYMQVDVIITYILLVGAIFLEIYALVILISSDWTKLWLLSKHKNRVVDLLHRAVSSISIVKSKMWSNTLAQYNLINFCLKQRPPKCILIQKVVFIDRLLEKYRYQDLLKDVSDEYLKKLIFEQLKEKSKNASNFEACKQLCARRGGWVLDKLECRDKLIGWTISGVEFDHSILLWHIATDLCYYSDVNRNYVPSRNCEASKQLSNYMLYLLVMRPFMLPNGIGEIRFRDTCAEAEEFFTERKSISDAKKACTLLLKVSTDILPSKVKGDRSKSVLFDACRLAKALQSQEAKVNWDKWMLMSQVWVEMLSYAANQCRWSGHAQQLRRGGELVTHVWLLMAHLGLTEQFQISEGHVRAKLIVQ